MKASEKHIEEIERKIRQAQEVLDTSLASIPKQMDFINRLRQELDAAETALYSGNSIVPKYSPKKQDKFPLIVGILIFALVWVYLKLK